MFPTVEVRWFYKDGIPSEILAWFQQDRATPEEEPARVDHYLRLTEGESLGIKLREGRVEIKQRYHQSGAIRFHQRVSGIVEYWRKWSFPLAQADGAFKGMLTPTSSWIGVKKERKLRRFHLSADKMIAAASPQAPSAQGCHLELTSISLGEELWWSLGLEAFGHEAALQENLLLTAKHIFAFDKSPDLRVKDSYGYPKWLKSLPEIFGGAGGLV